MGTCVFAIGSRGIESSLQSCGKRTFDCGGGETTTYIEGGEGKGG